MDLDPPIKLEDVLDNMERIIKKQRTETENDYRLRIWKSRELWDYVQLEWKEEEIDDEEYMMEKMLEMKRQVHRMDKDDIDKEVKDTILFMKTLDRSTKEHEYIWCEMYIEYLKERKDELHIEVGMKRCRM
jgi:hypothetical protein